MVPMHGKNIFQGCFDFFEWSAPYYDNPKLSEIKKGFSVYMYTEKQYNKLTDGELNELRKNRVALAVGFYSRFIKRIEAMMKLPGNDAICFSGP